MSGALQSFAARAAAACLSAPLLRPCTLLLDTNSLAASTLSSMSTAQRCASRRAAAAARPSTASSNPSKKKRSPRQRKTAAAAAPSKSTSDPPTPPSHSARSPAKEDVRLEENDVRLAMRHLMTLHLSRSSFATSQRTDELTKERNAFRERHEGRLRRLQIKDENARRLLGSDSRTLGDGIVPLMSSAALNPYQEDGRHAPLRRGEAGASSGGSAVWRTLNPIGLAASQAAVAAAAQGGGGEDAQVSEEDYASFLTSPAVSRAAGGQPAWGLEDAAADVPAELEDWKSATLATLSAPNLSVYDTDHDFRVSSEDVVRQQQVESAASGGSKGKWAAGMKALTNTTAGSEEEEEEESSRAAALRFSVHGDDLVNELSAGLTATAAAQLKRELAEEEEGDPDYAITMYTEESDDGDTGPLQL